MKIDRIEPTGPHIEGVIRFASEGIGENRKQLEFFEVLSRVHEGFDDAGRPKLRHHEIESHLAELPVNKTSESVRVIPIKLITDRPENSLKARYEAYDPDLGRLACVGDGENAARVDLSRGIVEKHVCKGPDACVFANEGKAQCRLHVRLMVQIEGQVDPFTVFELQSGGINTYRTLSSKLQMMHAAFGGKLRGIPLELAVYAKSGQASNYEPFFVADLRLRDQMPAGEALAAGIAARELQKKSGIDFGRIEEAIEKMVVKDPLTIDDAESSIVIFSPAKDFARPRRVSHAMDINAQPTLNQTIAAVIDGVKNGKAVKAEQHTAAPDSTPAAVTIAAVAEPIPQAAQSDLKVLVVPAASEREPIPFSL